MSSAQLALFSHRPAPFPGRPLVVVHRDDAARYTSDPGAHWSWLGAEGVEVVVLAGADHAMLEVPGVSGLAGVLAAWAAAAERVSLDMSARARRGRFHC